jgi:hypothetical protein
MFIVTRVRQKFSTRISTPGLSAYIVVGAELYWIGVVEALNHSRSDDICTSVLLLMWREVPRDFEL